MARTFLSFEERLAQIPTDRPVYYGQKRPGGPYNKGSRLYWQALWRDDSGKRHSFYIGQDKDGIIEARTKNKRPYEKRHQTRKEHDIVTQLAREEWSCTDHISTVPPDYQFTIVYDERGNRVVVDAYTDYYFVGNTFARTVKVNPDGNLYVKALSPDARREVTLAEFVWSIYHMAGPPNGYIVVQKKADLPQDPQDYRVRNLEVVRKPRATRLEEKRVEVKQQVSTHKRRKSA